MKNTLLLCIVISCHSVVAQVTILGKILNYDGKSTISYHPTIEGIYTPYWKEIKPAANGTFQIKFENEGYGNTTMSYKRARWRFFHDSDSKINLQIKELKWPKDSKNRRIQGEDIFEFIDSLKQAMTISIIGDYEAINKFYNKNLRSSYFTTRMVDGNPYSEIIAKALTPSDAIRLLDSLKQIELNQIEQLPKVVALEDPAAEKKQNEILEFLANEVHAFYGAVFLNGMFLKRKDHVSSILRDSTQNPNLYNREWELMVERLVEDAKLNLKPAANSADYLDLMESMVYTLENYQRYNFPQNPSMTLDDYVHKSLFGYDTALINDKPTRFAYELSGMHRYLNDQLFYSPALLHAIYDLQLKHSNSAHFEFFNEKIEKLKSNLELANRDFRGGRIIHANYDSFNDLIKKFEGKNLLVDIWATWCHPCVEEFKHKSVVQPFVENDKIELLFISIDKPEWEDRWKQSIKINELKGHHFRADKEFIADMWNVIGDFEGAIPRYVLIDKSGKIFKTTAARPSEGKELSGQIELMTNAVER